MDMKDILDPRWWAMAETFGRQGQKAEELLVVAAQEFKEFLEVQSEYDWTQIEEVSIRGREACVALRSVSCEFRDFLNDGANESDPRMYEDDEPGEETPPEGDSVEVTSTSSLDTDNAAGSTPVASCSQKDADEKREEEPTLAPEQANEALPEELPENLEELNLLLFKVEALHRHASSELNLAVWKEKRAYETATSRIETKISQLRLASREHEVVPITWEEAKEALSLAQVAAREAEESHQAVPYVGLQDDFKAYAHREFLLCKKHDATRRVSDLEVLVGELEPSRLIWVSEVKPIPLTKEEAKIYKGRFTARAEKGNWSYEAKYPVNSSKWQKVDAIWHRNASFSHTREYSKDVSRFRVLFGATDKTLELKIEYDTRANRVVVNEFPVKFEGNPGKLLRAMEEATTVEMLLEVCKAFGFDAHYWNGWASETEYRLHPQNNECTSLRLDFCFFTQKLSWKFHTMHWGPFNADGKYDPSSWGEFTGESILDIIDGVAFVQSMHQATEANVKDKIKWIDWLNYVKALNVPDLSEEAGIQLGISGGCPDTMTEQLRIAAPGIVFKAA